MLSSGVAQDDSLTGKGAVDLYPIGPDLDNGNLHKEVMGTCTLGRVPQYMLATRGW